MRNEGALAIKLESTMVRYGLLVLTFYTVRSFVCHLSIKFLELHLDAFVA